MSSKTEDAASLASPQEPFELFAAWFEEAKGAEVNDPEAMALGTVDSSGAPNARMVLMKAFDDEGFVFYTNGESAKGEEMRASGKASALFHWKSLRRQVRIRGNVIPVSSHESDAYFASRPRDSRIGAWASRQSRPLESRFALEAAVAKCAAKYAFGEIPRPPYWGGFRILPVQIEFWSDRPFRLHDRLDYRRDAPHGDWRKQKLYP